MIIIAHFSLFSKILINFANVWGVLYRIGMILALIKKSGPSECRFCVTKSGVLKAELIEYFV